MIRILFLLLTSVVLLSSCVPNETSVNKVYQTQNVVIIVVDGPRYSETWGDPTHSNIPVRDSLSPYGVLLTSFWNLGVTYTVPGHTAICTGNYQSIANNGTEIPDKPSIFQNWLKTTQESYTKCCIVASKDKLYVLSNCLFPPYQNQYRPYFDCGVNGDGTGGYRSDSITLERSLEVLATKQPKLMLIAFKDPDYFAHQNDSENYIGGIRKSDQYIGVIWNYLQNSPNYSDKTTLIITNDHGRHLDGISSGFAGHGDNCEGCRHIEFFALSPDFKQGQVSTTYDQLDISATIAEMLHFPMYKGKGKVMKDIFD